MIWERIACYVRNLTQRVPGRSFGLAVCVLLLLILAGTLQGPPTVNAQTPDPTDRVHEIARRLNCPTCAGRSLADCQTDTCTQWKQEIASQLQSGKSPQDVIDYFKARFGPTVLQEPPKEGVVLLLWVLPILALIGLVAGVAIVLMRVTAHRAVKLVPVQSDSDAALTDEYVRRVEEEVRRP